MNDQQEFEKKIKTQEAFFHEGPKQNNFLRPNTEGNNFAGTIGSNFGLKKIEGSLINDPVNNLDGEMD